ncbi:hypothetical protein [Roseomonas sp. KE0001]|uniref:hypothetical protein n=1 Tax=Roseomonas sp. KE0001 TaxID=2479201 RepID=UPI0018DFBDC2|nr:hypothetical protein [Roseomonas sp. KE0001]MBI0435959.1 hypothetical protein [Roseomonas sp. KE0001]
MRKFVVSIAALAGILAVADASAQGSQTQGGMMPMQQGQQGGMMMGCPMMQRMASLETHLRQLEERAGMPTPPAQPGAPEGSH